MIIYFQRKGIPFCNVVFQGTGSTDFSTLGEYLVCISSLPEPYRMTFPLFLSFLAVSWDVVIWLRLYLGLEFNSVLHKITGGCVSLLHVLNC